MGGESGGHRVQITVALITLSGVVFTALLANWDKVFSTRPTQAATVNPTPSPSAQPSPPNAAPTDSVERYADAQRSALDASSSALEGVAAQIANTPGIPDAPDIGGIWTSADGYRFEIEQKGDAYQYRQMQGLQETGYGSGRITGSTLRHQFWSNDGDGECTGTIETGGDAISGSCISAGERWTYRVFRSGGGKKG